MRDVKVKLKINPEVKPVANKHRRIPFHLRDKVEAEVNRLMSEGIIEPVTEPTGWVSPVVIVNKSDGSIRLCVDMTEPNKAIERVRHIMPTVDDIKYQVNGATVFSKLDLNHGYHQLLLDEQSRNITAFVTHKGLARFCRLTFGANSATEIFHNEIAKLVRHIKGVLNIQDDLFIFGRTQKDHDGALEQVLAVLEKANLTLNKSKCEFSKSSIIFYGLKFSQEGVSPDPRKIEALQSAEAPKTKSELRSFLGMVNYSAEFIENYASLTADLRKLTHDKVTWDWTAKHQDAFERVKKALRRTTMLSYFNPEWDTKVISDGSPFGVAGMLVQRNPKNDTKQVVAYASRSLSDVETRYGQIEREALAIYFACTKFQIYLLGKQFTVHTDHKPLVFIFNKPKSENPYRVERMRLKLQGFNFEVKYVKGSQNPIDYLSRKPRELTEHDRKESKLFEKHVNWVISSGLPDAVTLEEMKDATDSDEELKLLRQAVTQGHIDETRHPELNKFKPVFASLSVANGVIMKEHKSLSLKSCGSE